MTEARSLDRQVPEAPGPLLDDDDRREASAIVARYPHPRSAIVPLLYLVQSKLGWIPHRGLREVGELLGLRTAEVEAVASFYTMLKLRPTGRYVISICTNPSCGIRGGYALLDHARRVLGPAAEHVTDDGCFTLEEEECMGACDKAPVLTVNYLYFDGVTEEAFDRIVEGVRAGEVPEASRGGVPREWREVSATLAGAGRTGGPAGGAAPSGAGPSVADEGDGEAGVEGTDA